MPIRLVKIPPPFPIVGSGEPDQSQMFSFDRLLAKLQCNPVWMESYENMESWDAICLAWEACTESGVLLMILQEKDWVLLRDTVLRPRTIVTGPSGGHLQSGLGLHPFMTRPILPMLRAIVNAQQEQT